QLDYLVDGILTTSHEIQETHPERWIEMPKLRGVRIENESYPYTLEGGKFMCISPERREFVHPEVFVEPDPEPAEEAIWPGSKAFVEAFDRLRIGALTAIETDDHVTDAAIELLLFPMIASVLAGGGRVLYIPAPAQRLGELWSSLQGLLQPAQAQAQLRIVAPGATLPDAHPLLPCLMNVPRPTSDGPGAPIHSQIPKGREFVITPAGPNGSRNLAVVATDGLRLISNYSGSPYLPEALPVMIRSYDVGARPHIVFVARSTDPLVSGLRMIASLQISLRNRNGRTFASGLKPLTPAYSLTPRSPSQERAYGLLRIV
ncbi:MAG TPA: hypothetical protein VGS23_03230, partial [Thermoplasmata archaeon]|nr:hypothetical protein [Thermoplasmata archaeon]